LEDFLRYPFGIDFPTTQFDPSHWRVNFVRMDLISLYLYV
jgi:hypothetical protein